MSPLWRAELRVGLCPDRLVTAQAIQPVSNDAHARLQELAKHSRLCVILSNHLVRYAVLPWKQALVSDRDWDAYARHTFEATYGSAAADWRIRICSTGKRTARVACAVDAPLIESLRSIPGVVSIQPYLMAAFNARRRVFAADAGWFIVQERGRVTLALIANGAWQRIRVRHAPVDWRTALADLLERELAAHAEGDCDVAFSCTEEELPPQLGRFRVVDISLPRGAGDDTRGRIMALH